VFDIDEEKVKHLVSQGADFAASPEEIGRKADVIMMSLPHPKISEKVMLGSDGVLRGCSPGKMIIETSTISPKIAKKLGDESSKKSVRFIDAALAGGIERAQNASLVFMIGGDESAVKDAWPIFEALGKKIFYVGAGSTGMTVKIINNAISHVTMVAIAEAVSVGVKAGLDPNVIYDVLSAGSADSDILRRRYKGRILQGNYTNGMAVNHAYKDSELICEMARELGVPMFITNTAHAVYEWAKSSGYGSEDYAAIIKLWEEMLNLKITGSESRIK